MTDAALRGLLPGVPLVDSPFFARLLPELGFDAETERIARDLHAQGYARIAFPDPELPARASRIRRDLGAGFDLAAWRDGGWRAQAGLRVQDAWTRHDDVRAIAANPDLLALLGRLFGRRAFPFQTLNFPVGTQQHFHADSVHFSSIPEGFMCGIWVALEDVGPEAGPLVYYPGSHRWPRLDNAQIGLRVTGRGEAVNQGVYETVWRALVDSSGIAPVPFHARQGEAVIWLANLLHGGSRQTDPGRTRWSQVTHYFFDDCCYVTPMLSDMPIGQLFLRDLVDIATGRRMKNVYLGSELATLVPPAPPLDQQARSWPGRLARRAADLADRLLARPAPPPPPAVPADFDPERYRALHPDIRATGEDPAAHYVTHGRRERRPYR
jgi:hypothetical protein